MKRRLNEQLVSRHDSAHMVSVCNMVRNQAQAFYALRFNFFVYFFTRSPIRENRS